MNAWTLLRRRAPGLYKHLVLARHRGFMARRTLARRRVSKTLRRSDRVQITVEQDVGLGGLLLNAATALNAGRQTGCAVDLRFVSETYMPSWRPDDWLDAYFLRTRPTGDATPTTVAVASSDLERRFVPPAELWGELVWSHIEIRPEIRAIAAPYMEGDYAAVHFRGSDKFLEAGRVAVDRVLDRVEREMQARGLTSVFVASDETSFIDAARERLARYSVRVLPSEAVATADGVPPHFTDVPGEVKAREALATMVALAGAHVCVRTESYLSAWAETLAAPGAEFILIPPG